MAHINRRYIEKHWLMFILRGGLALVFSVFLLFTGGEDLENTIAVMSVFLLLMGIIDAVGALYASTKKHGWVNSVIDALVDVIAAVALLFVAKNSLTSGVVILSLYTIISGIIDLFHGFLSTVDPTDRFMRVLAGVIGCVIGAVILNAGNFEITTFVRFFGAYMLEVGTISLIYGVHNRAQKIEDKVARKEAAKLAKLARKPAGKKTSKKH